MKTRLSLIAILLFLFGVLSAAGQEVPGKIEKIDEIGSPFSSEDLSARVDVFGGRLEKNTSVRGLIRIYGPQGKGHGTVAFALGELRNYLVNQANVDPNRLITSNGGRASRFNAMRVEFWFLWPGAKLPDSEQQEGDPRQVQGKVAEYSGSEYLTKFDGYVPEISLGNVRSAGIADAMREQPNSLLYIVSYDYEDSLPSAWNRSAMSEVAEYVSRGIERERIKILYGGRRKSEGEPSERGEPPELQLFILDRNYPPPIVEEAPVRNAVSSQEIANFIDLVAPTDSEERDLLGVLSDVLQKEPAANVRFLIINECDGSQWECGNKAEKAEDESVDYKALAEKWTTGLLKKGGFGQERITVSERTRKNAIYELQVWIVPTGESVPEPVDAEDQEP